jgi:hypothetical protein
VKIVIVADYGDVFRRSRAHSRRQGHDGVVHTEPGTDLHRLAQKLADA